MSNPARYQAMFGAVGQQQADWATDQLPGAPVFDALHRLVSAATGRRRSSAADAFVTTVCLWAALHGLASLRISKPSFPWPPLDELVALSVEAQLAGRRAPA